MFVGYVPQNDHLMAALTVRETLDFYAQLKLPKEWTPDQKKERVEKIIQELHLTKCSNTLIGNDGLIRGVSGGELKRISIAVELLNEPSVLFLDGTFNGSCYTT